MGGEIYVKSLSFTILQKNKKKAYPVVSARSWAAIDAKTGDRLWSKGGDDLREVASLTKLMTALITWELAIKFKININERCIMVSVNATEIAGTSAGLKAGEFLSVLDLLHGLLIPSGNDAAVCLAEYFGGFIYDQRKKEKKVKEPKSFEVKQELFVKAMNKKAKALQMRKTKYWNPHGLHQKNNSTANDINYLCFMFKQVEKLREIVKKRIHIIEIPTRKYVWANTNLLLENEQYEGLKTGTTQNAGKLMFIYNQVLIYIFYNRLKKFFLNQLKTFLQLSLKHFYNQKN